jgi:hypothetical protein
MYTVVVDGRNRVTISETLVKLEGLDGPSRPMDFAIANEVGYHVKNDGPGGDPRWHSPAGRPIVRVPFFTNKVDEAAHLARMVFPDAAVAVVWEGSKFRAQLQDGPIAFSSTPALAVCIAVLGKLQK